MPHFTIEYSSNLEATVDIGRLCRRVLREVVATGLFEVGAVRVRTLRCDHYAIADELEANGFIDMSFRIGAGRSVEDRKRTGDAIFRAVTDQLGPLFDTPHFALSLEIREIDPVLSWKKNAIHQRLRHASPAAGQDIRP